MVCQEAALAKDWMVYLDLIGSEHGYIHRVALTAEGDKRVENLKIKTEKRNHDDEARPQSDQEGQGIKHAFCTIMGGFVIDVESEASFLPGQRKSLTLTANSIKSIAERFPTLLPEVSMQALSRSRSWAYKQADSSHNA